MDILTVLARSHPSGLSVFKAMFGNLGLCVTDIMWFWSIDFCLQEKYSNTSY